MMTIKRPNTKLVRKNAKLAKRVAHDPAQEGAEPINDTAEKLETGREVIRVPTNNAKEGAGPEFTVSPLRALLADRGRMVAKNQHVPTAKSRQGVMYGQGLGLSQKALATIMGISIDTLRSHYEVELAVSRDTMMSDIQANLYNIARDPNHKGTVQAGIYLLSKLGGENYREKKSVELSGPDGAPLQIDQRTQTIDPTLLSAEQRDALREIMTSAMKLAQQAGPVQLEGEYRDVTNDK